MENDTNESTFFDLPTPVATDQTIRVPVEQLVPDEKNDRVKLRAIAELAASFKAVGQLQPILVTPLGDGRYRIVAGHRRHAAAKLAGLATLSARVVDVSESVQQDMRFAENAQRSNLSAIETAEALRARLGDGTTIDALSARITKTPQWIRRHLALLKADPKIVRAMRSAGIGIHQAEDVQRVAKTSPTDALALIAQLAAGESSGSARAAQDTPARTRHPLTMRLLEHVFVVERSDKGGCRADLGRVFTELLSRTHESAEAFEASLDAVVREVFARPRVSVRAERARK